MYLHFFALLNSSSGYVVINTSFPRNDLITRVRFSSSITSLESLFAMSATNTSVLVSC